MSYFISPSDGVRHEKTGDSRVGGELRPPPRGRDWGGDPFPSRDRTSRSALALGPTDPENAIAVTDRLTRSEGMRQRDGARGPKPEAPDLCFPASGCPA